MKQVLILAFVFSSLNLFAAVHTDIEVFQDSSHLSFDVSISNTESSSLKFILNPAAIFSEAEDVKLFNTYYRFEVLPGTTKKIQYRVPYLATKNYFLSGLESWHPILESDVITQTFSLKSTLESGFEIISSATGKPQPGMAFVFGRFKKYSSSNNKLHVYLVQADPTLANTLLAHLHLYLEKFEKTYGAYPYDHFSVVESPNEIGYAFPKMTWIGSQLLRFPFILKTSLPHELLHSWWGNGVFVNYQKGNWCEGLTAFGADYALLNDSEKKLYRLKAITNYLNYVKQGKEISLAKFTSRGEDRSLQAIGYDKALMMFVMLEQTLGSEIFNNALKEFYLKYKFKSASYEDLFSVFTAVSDQDLSAFQKFWVHSTGLVADNFLTLNLQKHDSQPVLHAKQQIAEISKLPGFPIQAYLYSETKKDLITLDVLPNGQGLKKTLYPITQNTNAYSVDPDYFIFRALSDLEKPLNFSSLFASSSVQVQGFSAKWNQALKVAFPDKNFQEKQGSLDFSKSLNVVMSLDSALKLSPVAQALQKRGLHKESQKVIIESQAFDLQTHALFLIVRVQNSFVTVVHVNDSLPLLRWFQRWSHYGAQGYVVLNSKASALQGLWLDEFKRPL